MKRFVLTSIFCLGMTSTALAAPPTHARRRAVFRGHFAAPGDVDG